MKTPNIVVLAFFWTLFSGNILLGQSIIGKWKTIDDRTGKPKGVVEVYERNGLLYGKLIKILEKGKEDAICSKCEGERKNKPVLGMYIFKGLKDSGNGQWKGNTLFDPEQGMTFRCKIWVNPENHDQLKVRGYLAFIYRTQTWLRVDS
ncbi:MAG: DUF2147 domain-containing protein [Flavobacteriaceae bacterium]